jgi:hypothetical protein
MPLTFTLGGRCCYKDVAKFYFNTLSSSGEFLSEATPCPHLFARFLQLWHTPSSFLDLNTDFAGRTRSVQAQAPTRARKVSIER